MKLFKADGDYIGLKDEPEDRYIEMYGSIRDLYRIVYGYAMDYQKEKDERKRQEIEKNMEIAEKALISLSMTSRNATTILKNEEHLHFWERKISVWAYALTIIMALILKLIFG